MMRRLAAEDLISEVTMQNMGYVEKLEGQGVATFVALVFPKVPCTTRRSSKPQYIHLL